MVPVAARVLAGLVVLAALTIGGPASAQRRLALVIGNDLYPGLPASRQLQKAVNDARAVGVALEGIGFSVTRVENSSKSEMSRALGALEQAVSPGDIVFLFFAGHGIEVAGANYLLPSDVPAPVDKDGRRLPARALRDASFNANELLSSLQERGVGAVIAVFDACREPFDDEGKRSLGIMRGGLAEMKASNNMFIMFSAGAKQLALDRLSDDDTNPNSVFTRTLVPLLRQPGLSLVSMAKQLQPRVKELAGKVDHVQTPAYYDQIMGDFFLHGGRTAEATGPVTPPVDVCTGAYDHWRSAELIGTRGAVADHLARFPACNFAGLARAKMAAIDQGERDRDNRIQEARLQEQLREERAREERLREERAREERLREEQRLREARLRDTPDEQPDICRRSGSLWDVSGSVVFLEGTPTSTARKFYYCQPNGSVRASGARSGSLLFSGRRSGNRYEGTAYVFAGRCGAFSYSVTGDVSNGDRTVTISGRRPRVDESTCQVSGGGEYISLQFNYRSRVN